jgi:hypothetical protein
MPPRTVVQLVNTLHSVLDLIEKLHAMTAFDTSGKEMDEGLFTFDFHHADILACFFIFVSPKRILYAHCIYFKHT